ncbi:MAG: tetratricopeptide repeat protein [Myxococcales bacterium]
MFGRRKPFDRAAALQAAARASRRGRLEQAIREYRRVIEEGGPDPAVYQKLAPLLARRGQREASLAAFEAAAGGHRSQGFGDRALAVYAQATQFFPTSYGLWERLAELHLEAGRKADAAQAFRDARTHLRSADNRPTAILCLSRALELAPDRGDLAIDLARLCGQEGQRERAEKLLDEVEARGKPGELRRLRWARFRLAPSASRLWRWLFPRSGR